MTFKIEYFKGKRGISRKRFLKASFSGMANQIKRLAKLNIYPVKKRGVFAWPRREQSPSFYHFFVRQLLGLDLVPIRDDLATRLYFDLAKDVRMPAS
jgi:hypothetical protein